MNGCVITTFRCNARCQMCEIWKHPSKKEEEITPDIVDRLPDNLGRVNLTGGEPMLRDDIEELVRILYRKCRTVEISTNGYFTEKIVDIAKKFPRVMIRVSIEGLPKLNDRLRGIKDGFDHALRTILELQKTKIKDIGFSIVISDQNASDLISVYELCCHLGIEFAQSTMHNSWYFHKYNNEINDTKLATDTEKEFIKRLLKSPRSNLRMKIKDWLRAYFNLNILQHLDNKENVLSSCCVGQDLFFLDPHGDVLPCNGTEQPWIMGNLKEKSFREIWSSSQADKVRQEVASCRRECAFIGTARFDMLRRPWKPIFWIAKNKIKLALGRNIY